MMYREATEEEVNRHAVGELDYLSLTWRPVVKVVGPVYRPALGVPDYGTDDNPDFDEACDAWLDINELVGKGWLIEVGGEQA